MHIYNVCIYSCSCSVYAYSYMYTFIWSPFLLIDPVLARSCVNASALALKQVIALCMQTWTIKHTHEKNYTCKHIRTHTHTHTHKHAYTVSSQIQWTNILATIPKFLYLSLHMHTVVDRAGADQCSIIFFTYEDIGRPQVAMSHLPRKKVFHTHIRNSTLVYICRLK